MPPEDPPFPISALDRLRALTRAEPRVLAQWLRQPLSRSTWLALLSAIVIGCGLYGFSLGVWRAPLQGLYVAIKLPALICMTLAVNGLINGMLGQLLGTGMTFRQTLVCCLMSFAIFSLLMGSLSPILIAWVLDAPSPKSTQAQAWYHYFLLVNTGVIALAGLIANWKLLRLIAVFTGSHATGQRTLLAWLGGNLFVGAQLSFIFRPFFGNPNLPVQFLRPDPFNGNFYQTVWYMFQATVAPSLEDLVGYLSLFVLLVVPCLMVFYIVRSRELKARA
jgi:hypothetical protein